MAHKAAREGFTLVEAMVSGFLFLMLILAFTAAYLQNLKTQKMAINHFNANCIARNRIQRGVALDYTSLWGLSENNRAIDEDGYADPDGTYIRTTSVDTNYVDNATRIVVQVWYPAPVGRMSDEPVTVSTLIAPQMLE